MRHNNIKSKPKELFHRPLDEENLSCSLALGTVASVFRWMRTWR